MKHLKLFVLILPLMLSPVTICASEYAFEVKKLGKGDPIILLPGFASSGEVWSDVVKELEADYELHIFTLPGFAGVKPITFPWLPQVKTSIERYIKDNKLDNVVVIGHSMGEL